MWVFKNVTENSVAIIENQPSFNLESMKLCIGYPRLSGSLCGEEPGLALCQVQLAPAGLRRPTSGPRRVPQPGWWWLCENMVLRNQIFISKSKSVINSFKNCLISNSWAINQQYVLFLTCCPISELSSQRQWRYSSNDLREPRLYKTRSVTCWIFFYELLEETSYFWNTYLYSYSSFPCSFLLKKLDAENLCHAQFT